MNKEQYLKQRNDLLKEVENLINEGKIEESDAKMKEVVALDDKWEQTKLANANLNALKDKTTATNLDNKSLNIGGKTVAKIEETKVFTKENAISSEEYRNAYLKTLQGKTLSDVEQQAYSTATGEGAEVVPTIMADKIMKKVFQIAPVLEHMTNLFHVPNGLKFGIEGTNNDATMHTENAAITPSEDTLAGITLGAYEVTKALRVSRTVSIMSIDAFEDFLVQLLAENLAKKLENLVFNGTGSSQPTGIVKAGSGTSGAYVEGTDLLSIAAATAVTEADILAWYAMIGNHVSPKAYMSKATFMAYFYPLMNMSKNISIKFMNGLFYIMDVPVHYTNTLTKGTAYMAAMDQLMGNFAEDINVRKSSESGFLNNSIDYLGVCAFDCKPITGNAAFAKFAKAQS